MGGAERTGYPYARHHVIKHVVKIRTAHKFEREDNNIKEI
jgi:hypothetical protein